MSVKAFQPIRGTHDLMGADYRKHQLIIEISERLATLYGYEPISTPIFEATQVFKRTLGETSDVVGKEMYTFLDRGGDEITLRPEGTAGVVRAVVSNGLTQSLPLKFIYSGPLFRYERPQKGRQRQFHQLGVECLGIADPLIDVEVIALGVSILRELGLFERTVLEINTLGDTESRAEYRKALVAYLTPNRAKLSEDSQLRLERNPLRILDSKAVEDHEIIEHAPHFSDFLTQLSKDFFRRVCEGLEDLAIPFKLNSRLVRGLDYYNHTAFEFIADELGAQKTILAGGRYDGLVAQMGGPDTPGIGWAMGIDRTALMLADLPSSVRPIAVIPVGELAESRAFTIAMALRRGHIPVEFSYSGNVGKRMKRANKLNARAAILLGEDEITQNKAMIKDLDSGEQNLVSIEQLKNEIVTRFLPAKQI